MDRIDRIDRIDERRSLHIGCIIQARLDSTRLCHKVLKECPPGSGEIVLGRVLAAALAARKVRLVCLTTPDPALVILARAVTMCRVSTQLWRGERDPLAEYYTAATSYRMDVIVRLTADCPMLTGPIIDAAVVEFRASGADYGYDNCDGADVEVFTFAALAEAYEKAGPDEHEHVTTWVRRNKRCIDLTPPAGEFLSLNTAEDYTRICELMAKIGS